jgi:hypothetical protein
MEAKSGTRRVLKDTARAGGKKGIRLNAQQQKQKLARSALVQAKRLGTLAAPPKIVGLIALSDDVDLSAVARMLASAATTAAPTQANPLLTVLSKQMGKQRQHYAVYQCPVGCFRLCTQTTMTPCDSLHASALVQ